MALNSAKELLERAMNDAELRERIMQSEPDGIVALAGELIDGKLYSSPSPMNRYAHRSGVRELFRRSHYGGVLSSARRERLG